jgi:hypothetical protein
MMPLGLFLFLGLPLAVTVSLAFSLKKMAKDNSLVKKLVTFILKTID